MDDSAKTSQAIRPEHLNAFLALFKTIPDPSWAAKIPHPEQKRLQGDFFSDFPVVLLDPQESPRTKRSLVSVLNNTCDLQPGRSQLVNVVFAAPFKQYAEHMVREGGMERVRSFLEAVKRNKVDGIIYIATFPDHQEGVVIFLDRISTSNSQVFENALQQGRRIASLDQNSFYFFLIKLARFFARTESSEVTRDN